MPPKYSCCDFFTATVTFQGYYFLRSSRCRLDVGNKSYSLKAKPDIYKTILDSSKCSRFRFIPTGTQYTDFINNGDADKWERYTSSLRLRLAMRRSHRRLRTENRTAIEIWKSVNLSVDEDKNNDLIINPKSGQLNSAGHGLGDDRCRLASGAIIDHAADLATMI